MYFVQPTKLSCYLQQRDWYTENKARFIINKQQLIKCKCLLSFYSQLYVVKYGEFGRWSLIGVNVCLTTNSPNTVHTFCLGQVGRIKVKIYGAQRVKL